MASDTPFFTLSSSPLPPPSVNIKPLEVGTVAKHLLPKKMYDAWQAEVRPDILWGSGCLCCLPGIEFDCIGFCESHSAL
jgi:hypothetical protein